MIHLTLRQLEYFAAAAEQGGAARAAQTLGVSQPSISKAIAELESHWGEQLFVRLHARGLELTAAGAWRQRQARALLQQAAELAGAVRGATRGLLRVGCLSTLGPRYLPSIQARLRTQCPGLELRVDEADSETLVQRLERGALDVALLYDLGFGRALRLDPVGELRPYALLPWGHRLAARASVTLAELAREPLVLINLSHSREYFLSLFREAGCTPRVAQESGSLEMVRALVANGLGVSLLTTRPRRDWSVDGKRLACRTLRGAVRPQTVVLASAEDRRESPELMAEFSRAVREAFADSPT